MELVYLLVLMLNVAPVQANPPVNLRLVTLNLWHGHTPGRFGRMRALEAPETRRQREELQRDILGRLNPDVGLFQEGNPAVKRGAELAALFDGRAFVQLDSVGIKLFGYGVPKELNAGLTSVVRSNLRPRRVAAISLSHPKFNLVRTWGSFQFKEERFALLTEIEVDGRRVLLVNTHLHDGLDFNPQLRREVAGLLRGHRWSRAGARALLRKLERGNVRRRRDLHHLLNYVARFESGYAAVILAGDLNAVPGGEVGAMMIERGFRDAWPLDSTDPGYTYNQTPAACAQSLAYDAGDLIDQARLGPAAGAELRQRLVDFERSPRRLDYVWIKATDQVEVRRAFTFGQADAGGLSASDHLGVAVDLHIR